MLIIVALFGLMVAISILAGIVALVLSWIGSRNVEKLNKRALALLLKLEWDGEDGSCPRCGGWDPASWNGTHIKDMLIGHQFDCELGRICLEIRCSHPVWAVIHDDATGRDKVICAECESPV